MHRFAFDLVLSLTLVGASAARAQLNLASQFASGVSPVACAHDPASGTVWVYEAFGGNIRKYSAAGAFLGTVPRPGGSANDADLEVAPVAFSLGTTVVPAGSLLYIDGESGVAEIYAIDPASGAVIASLVTSFGNSHVVGGAFHPQRATIFLVQDRVPGATAEKNLIAEISPVTGQVLGSFQTTTANPAFTVNFGDLDVTANGNLLVVSSDESEIGQFTPQGAWVLGHPLPASVTGLCGIGADATGCGVWVASQSGLVSLLGSTCPTVVHHGNGCPSSGGSNTLTVTSLPWIGTSFRADATGLPAIAIALAVTSLQPLAPPIPLAAVMPQGVLGCNLHVTPDVIDALLVVNGHAQSQLFIPGNPVFVGVQLYHQMVALELDAALAIVSLTSTNAVRLTVGSY